jgi:transposase
VTASLSSALRVREVAAHYQVTDGRVLTWIKSGRLRAIDVSEGAGRKHRWRVTPEALAEFEAARTAVPTPRASRRRAKSGWKFQYF